MNLLFVEERSLPLFKAQAKLSGTFNHKCCSLPSAEKIPYQLTVERGSTSTTFIVQILGQRHSVTLKTIPKGIDIYLAEFVESIANGRTYTGELGLPRIAGGPSGKPPSLDDEQVQQLRSLIGRGGFLQLELGFDHPVLVALHRACSRPGLTAILINGTERPSTRCFTVYGEDSYAFDRLAESVAHLAAAESPAAHDR